MDELTRRTDFMNHDTETVLTPRTNLPSNMEAAIYRSILEVSHFIEHNKPIGWVDEIGCALLQSLHPELEIVAGEIDIFIVHPNQEDPTQLALGWIGGDSVQGCWLEIDGHVIDPFADQRMRSRGGTQTDNWHPLPIVMRSAASAPYDIIYRRKSSVTRGSRHDATREVYNAFISQADTSSIAHKEVLSNRGLAHIAGNSLWARVALIADIQTPPLFPGTAIQSERASAALTTSETHDARISAMLQKKPVDWEAASIASLSGIVLGLSILAAMNFAV